ncbi:MAG: hypothetical protein HWE27_04445 [Gammaproteobacteria bacterium]|nr:hypothetical protein [Gammaproteobacteria bacterium]
MLKHIIFLLSALLVMAPVSSLQNPNSPNKPGGDNPGKKQGKVMLCHNGSSFDYDLQDEVPVSFVIDINRNALDAHLNNHDDCDSLFVIGEPVQVCELQDDGITIICEEKSSCNCLSDEDPVTSP